MKTLLLIFILSMSITAQAQKATLVNFEEGKIETVDFCELIRNPLRYEGRKIRVAAIWAYGGEDHNVLYCPQCYREGVIKPLPADLSKTQTKRKFLDKLSRRKHSSGTVKITAVGKFSKMQFSIENLEKADYLTKDAGFPDRLSEKVMQKVACSPE